jgi:hypothetical protein
MSVILNANFATASVFSEIPAISKKIAGFFKKTTDDIPASGNANSHLNDANKLPPVNTSDVERPLSDFAPFNATASLQTGKCIAKKLSADPKISPKEADQFCKRAFYKCVADNQNSLGFSDSKCLSAVNEGRPYTTYEPYSFSKKPY